MLPLESPGLLGLARACELIPLAEWEVALLLELKSNHIFGVDDSRTTDTMINPRHSVCVCGIPCQGSFSVSKRHSDTHRSLYSHDVLSRSHDV